MKNRNEHLIFLAGGGTAGHVYPNMALAKALRARGFDLAYLGNRHSIEEKIVTAEGIRFYRADSAGLARNGGLKVLKTPFIVLRGIFQSLHQVRVQKPALIFCKGGYGSLAPAVAGFLTGTPVVAHESDMTPGLANKLCTPFAKKVCVTFQDTLKYLPEKKGVFTGTPIRSELTEGSRKAGFDRTGLNPDGKPVLLVMGGSLGAKAVNEAVLSAKEQLLEHFQILHLFGSMQEGNDHLVSEPDRGYFVTDYANEELRDYFAISDVVLSRAGANAINELLLLKKPAVLVPLPLTASRGDQILNAEYFEKHGFAKMLPQEDITDETLLKAILEVYQNRDAYIRAMSSGNAKNGTDEVVKVILGVLQG